MYKIPWKSSIYRKDKFKPVQKSIKQSEYVKQLMKIGAGFNDKK